MELCDIDLNEYSKNKKLSLREASFPTNIQHRRGIKICTF